MLSYHRTQICSKRALLWAACSNFELRIGDDEQRTVNLATYLQTLESNEAASKSTIDGRRLALAVAYVATCGITTDCSSMLITDKHLKCMTTPTKKRRARTFVSLRFHLTLMR